MSSPKLQVTKQTYPDQSFLYTSNEQDTEIKTTMPFTITQKNEMPRRKSNKTLKELIC